MDPEALANASYVLIRHGLSEFNLAAMIAADTYGQDSPEFRTVE